MAIPPLLVLHGVTALDGGPEAQGRQAHLPTPLILLQLHQLLHAEGRTARRVSLVLLLEYILTGKVNLGGVI